MECTILLNIIYKEVTELEDLDRLNFIMNNAAMRKKETWDIVQKQELKQLERAYLEAVMWLAVGTEWFERNEKANHCLYKEGSRPKNLSKDKVTEEYYYLLGIKQIFNSFKHNMKITSFDEENYEESLFGISLQQFLWISSSEMDVKVSIQFESFQANFENQTILGTLEKANQKLYALKKGYINLK